MEDKTRTLDYIDRNIKQVEFNIEVSTVCEGDDIPFYEEILTHFTRIRELIQNGELAVNYLTFFQHSIDRITDIIPFRHLDNYENITRDYQYNYADNKIKTESKDAVKQLMNQLLFLLDFFTKLGFFNKNIVAVGANGSGKTSLSNALKMYLSNNGVVISAQKILAIPKFNSISNVNNTKSKLSEIQKTDKTNKGTYESSSSPYHILEFLGSEFKYLLDNLLAERNVEMNMFCNSLKKGGQNTKVPKTKLDIALEIWNYLIEHRKIECEDGINITLKTIEGSDYPAHQMSDGEKVILYLIAQVLQAPKDGFIIVDEPEMYLHKTILKKLWDILEKERKDCLFVYLTHDLEFATSRVDVKKVWIKSFTYPAGWDFEEIPENEIPQALIMELLGSRKNILFCEGKNGSYDEQIYNILFPNFTIKPLGSCSDVINYTRAFNKLKSVGTNAFGVIDADFQNKNSIKSLRKDSIYPLGVAEVENLLLDEDFLNVLAKQLMKDGVVDSIKEEIIKDFKSKKDLQVSNFLSAKVNYFFTKSHMSKGNNFTEVDSNLKDFISEVKLENWYKERVEYIDEVIDGNDYSSVLKVFNNKGLKAIANKKLSISDFSNRAIELLKRETVTHDMLRKYFPEELKN